MSDDGIWRPENYPEFWQWCPRRKRWCWIAGGSNH